MAPYESRPGLLITGAIYLITVSKYKKNDEDESLKEKFSRLNIHSISKKSKRVTSHLKILTGGEPQVINHPENCPTENITRLMAIGKSTMYSNPRDCRYYT